MQPSHDPTTDMEVRTDSEAREKVMDLIREARFAMFGTYDATGRSHSRPMAAVKHEEPDTLWFFCRADSRKVREIERDRRVTIDYSDPSNNHWISVLGHAEVVNDRGRIDDLWMEPLRTWFPDGKDDPEIRLLKVEIEVAEYWDAPSSIVTHGYGYLKAVFTGEPPALGDIAQVRM